jgi:SpoVK/Ycf46/Vps4 family AAA+-type ATPase
MTIACPSCQQDNRAIAKFCKRCATALPKVPAPDPRLDLDGLVGLTELKREIGRLIQVAEAGRMRQARGGVVERRNLHTIIYGQTGTGKSHVAKIIYRLFHHYGLAATDHVVVMDVVSPQEFEKELDANFKKAAGGVLFIDNGHRLLKAGGNGPSPIDKLLSRMDAAGYDPIVVIAGLRRDMRRYVEEAPELRGRFAFLFDLPDFNADELHDIAVARLARSQLALDSGADDKARRLFRHLVKTKDATFANARVAIEQAESMQNAYLLRVYGGAVDDGVVIADDIVANTPSEKSVDDILAELDAFIGMKVVKDEVRALTQQIRMGIRRAELGVGSREVLQRHFVITGNPGTGKTTITRKLAEIFAAIGLLDRGHVIEVDPGKLEGQFIGQAAQLVNQACDEAMGGVLFIDEAYGLASGAGGTGGQYGQKAVDALLKRMEDDRGKFIVVVAGYRDRMDEFFRMNPGLPSRFDTRIHIDDYSADELREMFVASVKQRKLALSPAADERLGKVMKHMYDSRGREFANGRSVRQLLDQTASAQSSRVSMLPLEQLDSVSVATIEPSDITYALPATTSLDDVLGDLTQLVGMDNIKRWITGLAQVLAVQAERETAMGRKLELKTHVVLTGNPGTGKTTVARILGKVLKHLGVLPGGQVIDVDRSRLVAGYVGQTAKLTSDVIDSALGGVLLVDEAYTLASDSFGKEAVDTLLKRMEDDRGKFVLVAAGYPNEMRQFLDTNPGLSSRFSDHFHIEDYTPPELAEVFVRMAGAEGYRLAPDVMERLTRLLGEMYAARDKRFGNARTVRSLFEQTVVRQNGRISALASRSNDDLSLLTAADIPGGEAAAAVHIDDVLAELNTLIGMSAIKQQVRQYSSLLGLQRARRDAGAKNSVIAPHFLFRGNPGTGKTTVARIMARVFKSLDLLPKGHLVEVDRSALVASYVGQTAKLTNDAIDSAMGGVLFIDEAYTLATDDFGREALTTLLKRMEDDRGKFIVIAAGYHKEMDDFLASNTGLPSRFTEYVEFEDYTPPEMAEIFRKLVASEGMSLDGGADALVEPMMARVYASRDATFANGRTVRNLFDQVRQRQAARLAPSLAGGAAALDVIVAADIP